MQRGQTEFHGLVLPQFCYSRSKIAIIPTTSTEKHVKFLWISLETMIWGNKYVNTGHFDPKRWKMTQKFDRDSNCSLKLLTFQLSNVKELETIKYAFASKPQHTFLYDHGFWCTQMFFLVVYFYSWCENQTSIEL